MVWSRFSVHSDPKMMWRVVATCATAAALSAPTWQISLNVGREPDTKLPEAWGASGARFLLPLEVSIETDQIASPDAAARAHCGPYPRRVRALRDATYVNDRGQQTVRVLGGGWAIAATGGDAFDSAQTLRLWLDFADGAAAARNDVTLTGYPGNERLFLEARCWRAGSLARATDALAPLRAATDAAQAEIDAQLDHATGDRRLDGDDPVAYAAGAADMAKLVLARDRCLRRQRDLEMKFGAAPPRDPSALARGRWCDDGRDEPLAIAPGKIVAGRDRMFLGPEFQPVGTWRASPVDVAVDDAAEGPVDVPVALEAALPTPLAAPSVPPRQVRARKRK